jgi:hypothetical protein
MKLENKVLKTTEELEAFVEAYRQISGLKVSMDYLKAARVTGIFCNGKMEAGYVFNASGTYRYEMYLTNEERANCEVFKDEAAKKNLVEITCVWANKKTFCTKFLRTRVMLNILKSLYTFRNHTVIVSTFIPGLEKMFIKYFPNVVYAGTTTFFGAPKAHKILKGSLWTVLAAAPAALVERVTSLFNPMRPSLPAPAQMAAAAAAVAVVTTVAAQQLSK